MALHTGLAPIVPLSTGGSEVGAVMGPHIFAPFGFFLVLLLVGAIAYTLFKSTQGGTDSAETRTDQALETLRRRYANGEIDSEEFQTRKERLVR